MFSGVFITEEVDGVGDKGSGGILGGLLEHIPEICVFN